MVNAADGCLLGYSVCHIRRHEFCCIFGILFLLSS